MRKIWNPLTNGYKISIFGNGVYICSTDMQKTCKAAIVRYKELFNPDPLLKITAKFGKK